MAFFKSNVLFAFPQNVRDWWCSLFSSFHLTSQSCSCFVRPRSVTSCPIPNSAICAAHLSICGRIPHQIWHQGKSNGSPSSLLVHHLPVNKPSDARHRYKLPTAFYTASVISLYELQIWRRSDDLYVKRSVTGRPSYKKHPKYNGLSPSLCTICFSAASPDGPS